MARRNDSTVYLGSRCRQHGSQRICVVGSKREGTEMASETSDPSPRSYPPSVSFVRRAGPVAVAPGIADTFAQIEKWLLEEASAERQMIDLLVKLI